MFLSVSGFSREPYGPAELFRGKPELRYSAGGVSRRLRWRSTAGLLYGGAGATVLDGKSIKRSDLLGESILIIIILSASPRYC